MFDQNDLDGFTPAESATNKKGLFSKFLLFTSIIALVVIISGIFTYAYFLEEINKEIKITETSITLTIPKGAGIDQIGKYLYDQKVISNPLILKTYLYLNNKTVDAGIYRISTNKLNLIKLVDYLQDGTFAIRLTFIEGWRKEEYADYLKKSVSEDFAKKFIESDYIKEGYLFPDTYEIEEGYDAESLASWMRNNFDKKFNQVLIDEAEFRGLTQEQVVILASIVEREVSIDKDRAKIAGIYVKRLQNGWPLQADATIQYAKGTGKDWWPTVSSYDLKNLISLYNTYLNKGLPPKPICNPGIKSIESVVKYEETSYWFYITGKDGVTHYAETLEEHNQNISKYL